LSATAARGPAPHGPGDLASPPPQDSYHGQPILKDPVWSWEIADYLFAGGLSGASAMLAWLSGLRGNETLARRAWWISGGSMLVCPPLLIADLGRPERFFYMLRMFKITSPMSVGSWILSLSGATSTLAAFNAATGRFATLARLGRPLAGISGLGLSTYTAALFAQTSVPVWHEARRSLPFVFAAGAAVSAGGAATALTPLGSAAPARRLAVGAALAELGTTVAMERSVGLHGETFERGRARTYKWVSRACLAAGGGLIARLGSSRRPAAAAGGALLCAGALATRWSIFEAGRESASDPRYVVEPQRERRKAKAAPGV
jgi:hypothetical protein